MVMTPKQKEAIIKYRENNREKVNAYIASFERNKYNTNEEFKQKKLEKAKEYRERINADEELKQKAREYQKKYREARKKQVS